MNRAQYSENHDLENRTIQLLAARARRASANRKQDDMMDSINVMNALRRLLGRVREIEEEVHN